MDVDLQSHRTAQGGHDFLLFSSGSGAHYVYDAITASIHPWPWPLEPHRVADIYETPDEELEALLKTFNAPPDLFTYVKLWRQSSHAFRPGLDGDHCRRSGVRQPPEWKPSPSVFSNLMLVLTDACNLRCGYCIFSGQYEGYKPFRSRQMNWETAKAGVDHFLQLNDLAPFRYFPNRKLDIAFFGGEPLLEGGMIQRVVEYAESRKKGHYRIHFSMTTNLTHLPDSLARFFVDHSVGVECSMDGPQETHDRYRVDAAGKGSFIKLRNNLEKLYSLDKKYFADYVRATVTLTGHSNLMAVNDFFESQDPLIPPVTYVGYVREGGFQENHPFDEEAFAGQYRRLLKAYLDRKRNRSPVRPGSFLYQFFEEPLRMLHERLMWAGSSARASYTGTCQAGRRIAVSTDGKLHLCERINENFPIGDVKEGINLKRCAEVLSDYYRALPDCERCWARAICTTCFAQVCTSGGFVFTGAHCKGVRKGLERQLSILYTLLEDVPDALSSGNPLVDGFGPMDGVL
jgi:uncharacterized protein